MYESPINIEDLCTQMAEHFDNAKDRPFFIGKGKVKPKDYYILGVDLAEEEIKSQIKGNILYLAG